MYADLTEEEQIRYQMDYLSSNPRKDELMGLHQTIREEGLQQGLREAIELGLNLRFGDKGTQLMDRIRQIDDTDRLYMIKNAVLTAKTIPEFQNIIEKRPLKRREH